MVDSPIFYCFQLIFVFYWCLKFLKYICVFPFAFIFLRPLLCEELPFCVLHICVNVSFIGSMLNVFLFLLPLCIILIVCAYWVQESIRNSADRMILSAPDALVVSISKDQVFEGDQQPNVATVASTPRKNRVHNLGIDGLDLLKFTYKVYIIFRFTSYHLWSPYYQSTFISACIGYDRSLGRLNLLLIKRLSGSITM